MNLIKYRNNEGEYSAVVISKGRKFISLIPLTAYGETGLKVLKVPLREERNFRPLLYKGLPYPWSRALKGFRKAYRTFGGTKAVKTALYN